METPPDSPATDEYPDFPTPPHLDADGWFYYNHDDEFRSTEERSWTHTFIRKDHGSRETHQTVRSGAYTTLEDIREEFSAEYDFRYANETNDVLTIRYLSLADMEEYTDIIEIHGLSPDELYLLSNEIVIPKERLE